MNLFIVWFTKITGILAHHIAFRVKIYYEDKKVQSRKIKGPAIIISNHTQILDYALYLFVFWGRVIRCQMAEVLFNKKLLGWMLRKMGGIFVDRNTFDFSFVNKSQQILEKGGTVMIFPEARIPLPDEKRPLEFKSSAAYLAHLSDVQVIPVVTNGVYFTLKRRARCLIGKPFNVNQWWDPEKSQRENLSYCSQMMRKEIIRLSKELKKRQERDELRPPFYYALFDFMKITGALPALLWYRPKMVYSSKEAKQKHKKGVLFYSNHVGFKDPLYIMIGIWYRRIHFVTLQQILDNPKMKFWFEKCFRVIPIDRENVGFVSFKRVSQFLDAGCAVSIFPEGHIKTNDDDLGDFKNGLVLMGVMGKVKLVPLFVTYKKHWYSRLVIIQGEPIDLIEMYGPTPSMEQIEEAGKLCRERELELAQIAKNMGLDVTLRGGNQ